MKDIRVVVVDDSPFSVAMISNLLVQNSFQVVGSANGMDEAVEVVTRERPDVVTMDITMPGADGIEVTYALHRVDPNVKVVIVSSMMDDEIVRRAKKAKISGFVQKPVDAPELALLLNRIMADEDLFVELKGQFSGVFKEALSDSINRLFKSVPEFTEESNRNTEQISRGISVVIGIIGKYCGRLILDMSADTAKNLTGTMLNIDQLSSDYIVNIVSEIANIVSGNACSMLNRQNELFGLRVAPPTAVYGEAIKISRTEFDTVYSVKANTVFGEIFMNIGFTGSEY